MVVSRQTSTASNYSELVKASLIGSTVAGVLFGVSVQMMRKSNSPHIFNFKNPL